jgi:hypothetical protein
LRVYGKFTKTSAEILKNKIKGQTIVPLPIHRIIPTNAEKGIYMIAYNDNEPAKILSKYIENTEKNRDYWCRLLEKSLGIEKDSLKMYSLLDYYWKIGTHYYKPLSEKYSDRKEFIHIAQRPMNGMFIVGEMISINQGWTEGALESVDAIMKEI